MPQETRHTAAHHRDSRLHSVAEAYTSKPSARAAATAASGRTHKAQLHDTSLSSAGVSTYAATPTKKERHAGMTASRPPPIYLSAYLDAMESTFANVWGPLGFFDLPEVDFHAFLRILRRYYKRVFANPSEQAYSEDLGAEDDSLLVRNGLWRGLSNSVFYCLTVLDPRRLRACATHPSDLEVRTGGVEDRYEVVYNTSPKDDGEAVAQGVEGRHTYYATPYVPVPLRWKQTSDTPPSQRNGRGAETSSAEKGGPSSLGSGAEDEGGGLARLHSRLTDLPIADWYLTLRCLAQVGYRRDAFYTQTPSQGSPHELLLALLWLTKKYELIAVAEYVELNTNYSFLLEYHGEGGESQAEKEEGKGGEGDALLAGFGLANSWPPTSTFDEAAAIADRLAQIDALVGPTSSGSERGRAAGGKDEKASAAVRRLMAIQRLVTLSLNRLQHALEQRAEQASALGLHCATDLQLCLREHHTTYMRVLEGLRHVSLMPARVQGRLDHVAECGLLVAQALRRVSPLIRPEEVVAGLKEDDSTWLAEQDNNAEDREGKETENLAAVLGRFRAARTKQYLADRWKSMVRQERAAPVHDADDKATRHRPAFALDGNAQYREECRVHNNVISRYSLGAALAAEVMVLQCQQQRETERRQSDPSFPASSSGRGKGPVRKATPAVTTLALVPLTLTTTAVGTQGREAVVGSQSIQATEVGPPAPGATTSARVEMARLSALQRELEGFGEQRRQERVARCQHMLKQLYQVYGMRLALGCIPAKAKAKKASQQ